MKILQINKFFYKKGGSEVYFFALRDLLRQRGHEVMDFSMNNERNEPSQYQQYFINPIHFDGEKSFWEKIKNSLHILYSFEAARNLDKLIKEQGKPDVAHLHNFSYQLSPSIIRILRKHKIPIVWTLHDYKLISPNYNLFTRGKIDLSTKPDKYFSCVKNKCVKNSRAKSFLAALEIFLHRKVTRLYNKVDCYIAPSKFLQNLVVEWGIKRSKVFQLYNFIDYDLISTSSENEEYYLFVGRLVEEKGIMQMLETFHHMPERQLKIIGSGPLEEQVHEFIAKNGLPHITMLGGIYKPEVYDYIRKAKALILPSIWLENNPIVAMDAMACGKPIIGADIGGIPELIEEGVTGLLFDPFSEAEMGLKVIEIDKYDQKAMSLASRQRLEVIANPNYHYETLMLIYRDLVK